MANDLFQRIIAVPKNIRDAVNHNDIRLQDAIKTDGLSEGDNVIIGRSSDNLLWKMFVEKQTDNTLKWGDIGVYDASGVKQDVEVGQVKFEGSYKYALLLYTNESVEELKMYGTFTDEDYKIVESDTTRNYYFGVPIKTGYNPSDVVKMTTSQLNTLIFAYAENGQFKSEMAYSKDNKWKTKKRVLKTFEYHEITYTTCGFCTYSWPTDQPIEIDWTKAV